MQVAAIPGEDAAPEAFSPTLELLERFALPIDWVFPAVGQAGLEKYGKRFPDEARAAIDQSDATLFGSTSGPSAEALFYLRWGKQTYANVRPTRFLPGCRSPLVDPEGIDFVIVRENLEDLYMGLEGDVSELAPLELHKRRSRRGLVFPSEGKWALKVISEAGTQRVMRFGCELARKRKSAGHRGRVTVASKYNVLPGTDGYFIEVARGVADEYPDLEFDTFIADDFAQRLITEPKRFDVIVLPNLYGDIFSDAAAGLVGGLGLAPSGCYGTDYAYFESAHGSAPDIAGQNAINPTATILSAALMLEYLGFPEECGALTRAVESVYAEAKVLTRDQGGSATTTEFCTAVSERL